jgi:hypothetical protein
LRLTSEERKVLHILRAHKKQNGGKRNPIPGKGNNDRDNPKQPANTIIAGTKNRLSSLEKQTRKKLYAHATRLKIAGRSGMKKSELARAIQRRSSFS